MKFVVTDGLEDLIETSKMLKNTILFSFTASLLVHIVYPILYISTNL